jgi:hypothetical protein
MRGRGTPIFLFLLPLMAVIVINRRMALLLFLEGRKPVRIKDPATFLDDFDKYSHSV